MTKKEQFGAMLALGFGIDESLALLAGVTPVATLPTGHAAILQAAFDISDDDLGKPLTVGAVPASVETVDVTEPVAVVSRKRRRRGRGASKVVYRLTKAGRIGAKNPKRLPDMFPTMEQTFAAIAKAGSIGARALETATGLKQKTVESDVYKLRTLGVIESVKADK